MARKCAIQPRNKNERECHDTTCHVMMSSPPIINLVMIAEDTVVAGPLLHTAAGLLSLCFKDCEPIYLARAVLIRPGEIQRGGHLCHV
jgi:hypothetical protein